MELSQQAYVLQGCTLLQFIQHVLNKHNDHSWLIVCSPREAFEDALQDGLAALPGDDHGIRFNADTHPTMRTLAATGTLKLAFTADLAQLRAFLATMKAEQKRLGSRSVLAILDPLAVHRAAVACTAQGLSRTFAVAVDTAAYLDSTLIVYEQPMTELAEDESATNNVDPWDVDIGIIDVRTKAFGPGSRGWSGRTIKTRRVAERWMTFQQWNANKL